MSVKIKQPNGKRLFVRSGEANEPNLSFAPSDEHGIIRLKEIPLRSTVLINVFHPEFLPPSQIKMECGDPPATFVLRRGDATLKLVFYDVKGTRLTNEEMPLEIYLRSQPINFSLHRILTTNGAFSFRILNTRISESAATHSC